MTKQQFQKNCAKFTTKQLQDALVALYKRTDEESKIAYALTFDVVLERMGDEAFDNWCDTWYV